jgi:mono/diheme cytochrome c family protein
MRSVTVERFGAWTVEVPDLDSPTMRPGLLLATLLLLVSGCTSVDPNATGPEVFAQVCASCHGINLDGGVGPSLGPDSEAASKPDESLLTTIITGRARMPSFRNQLTEDQIRGLVEYIRAVQGAG